MKVRHIKSLDLWLLTKGNRVLYRGIASPWKSPDVIAAALRRVGPPVLRMAAPDVSLAHPGSNR